MKSTNTEIVKRDVDLTMSSGMELYGKCDKDITDERLIKAFETIGEMEHEGSASQFSDDARGYKAGWTNKEGREIFTGMYGSTPDWSDDE